MTIIWDFNGTLLNDMQVCIDCMNIMLEDRKLPVIDLNRYRDIFTFPVRDYYLSLGFDFENEPFEIPAHQFIDLYRAHLSSAPLHNETIDILEYFRQSGTSQIILSAMEQDFLMQTLAEKGILNYFDRVYGITNHLGNGKLEMAKKLIASIGEKRQDICLVGDTIHDFEVALGSGIRCILIAQGHQSLSKLKQLDCLVLNEIKELKDVFPADQKRNFNKKRLF